MYCRNCGKDRGNARFCRWCGTEQENSGEESNETEKIETNTSNEECDLAKAEADGALIDEDKGEEEEGGGCGQTESDSAAQGDSNGAFLSTKRKRIIIGANVGIAAALLSLIIGAVATMEVWEKVDDPGQQETIHFEKYETGKYVITMDERNPCYVNQDWGECINMHVEEYNRECTKQLADDSSRQLCSRYADMIDDMKDRAKPGWIVTSLGTWGHLKSSPQIYKRAVSNNDFIPASTHTAYCVFGVFGECKDEESEELAAQAEANKEKPANYDYDGPLSAFGR